MNKICWDCKELKSLVEFYMSTARKDGRQGRCIKYVGKLF